LTANGSFQLGIKSSEWRPRAPSLLLNDIGAIQKYSLLLLTPAKFIWHIPTTLQYNFYVCKHRIRPERMCFFLPRSATRRRVRAARPAAAGYWRCGMACVRSPMAGPSRPGRARAASAASAMRRGRRGGMRQHLTRADRGSRHEGHGAPLRLDRVMRHHLPENRALRAPSHAASGRIRVRPARSPRSDVRPDAARASADASTQSRGHATPRRQHTVTGHATPPRHATSASQHPTAPLRFPSALTTLCPAGQTRGPAPHPGPGSTRTRHRPAPSPPVAAPLACCCCCCLARCRRPS
jgi:hypothetical protein